MALQASVAYTELILGPNAFEDIFEEGCIEVYTGPQPAAANLAASGTLLGRVTLDGGAWSVGSTANGLILQRNGMYIIKPVLDTWAVSVAVSGNAGWWRLCTAYETGGPSYSLPRIDGSISATPGAAEWTLPNTGMAAGSTVPIQSFVFTIPPIPA